jgi:hypothetical protein
MQFSFAQEKVIKGVVSDSSGPIPGVNVVVKGTKLVYKLTLTVSFQSKQKNWRCSSFSL